MRSKVSSQEFQSLDCIGQQLSPSEGLRQFKGKCLEWGLQYCLNALYFILHQLYKNQLLTLEHAETSSGQQSRPTRTHIYVQYRKPDSAWEARGASLSGRKITCIFLFVYLFLLFFFSFLIFFCPFFLSFFFFLKHKIQDIWGCVNNFFFFFFP